MAVERNGLHESLQTERIRTDWTDTNRTDTDRGTPLVLAQAKDRLKDGRVNAINFLAGIAQGLAASGTGVSSERFSHAYEEVIDNAVSLAVEHPKAEATRQDFVTYTWEQTDSGWKMKSRFGYMDEMMDEALRSSQTLPFERPRFIVNRTNYDLIQQDRIARLNGTDTGKAPVFVEFSPSPLLTPEARQRGYLGNSTIFFFEFDPVTGQERMTQRWLKADWNEFRGLIGQLDQTVPAWMTDVDIMTHSGFFPASDLEAINQFIDTHNGQTVSRPQLDQFIQTDLRDFMKRHLEEVLIDGGAKLLVGEDVTRELETIEAVITYAQNLFKEKIQQWTGRFTNHITISDGLRREHENDLRKMAEFVKEKKMPLVGCGVNSSSQEHSIFGMSGLWDEKDQFGSLEYTCPHCRSHHRRERGKLQPKCPSCGEKVCA